MQTTQQVGENLDESIRSGLDWETDMQEWEMGMESCH